MCVDSCIVLSLLRRSKARCQNPSSPHPNDSSQIFKSTSLHFSRTHHRAPFSKRSVGFAISNVVQWQLAQELRRQGRYFSMLSVSPHRNPCRKALLFNRFWHAESAILARGVFSGWWDRTCSLANMPLTYGCGTGVRQTNELSDHSTFSADCGTSCR